MIRHNIYEELCRIREILAMQILMTGLALPDREISADTRRGNRYEQIMIKCLRAAFPEEIEMEEEEEEEELCDICLKPRVICRGEHA